MTLALNEPCFMAAVFPQTGEPYLKRFESLALLANFLRTLSVDDFGFAFHGVQIPVTAAPWRYLVFKDESAPLFDSPKPGQLDRSPYFGNFVDKLEKSNESADYAGLMKDLPVIAGKTSADLAAEAATNKLKLPEEDELPTS